MIFSNSKSSENIAINECCGSTSRYPLSKRFKDLMNSCRKKFSGIRKLKYHEKEVFKFSQISFDMFFKIFAREQHSIPLPRPLMVTGNARKYSFNFSHIITINFGEHLFPLALVLGIKIVAQIDLCFTFDTTQRCRRRRARRRGRKRTGARGRRRRRSRS